MKQLICEMCGSADLLKQDGVFVCQTCGTKYSVEEARKMMVEGTVEVTGTVKVDNTAAIANYLQMANSALEAGNNEDAEGYANKIIELDSQHSEAWLIKGEAAGWQSKSTNPRLSDAVTAWLNSIKYAPKDKRREIQQQIANKCTSLMVAMIDLRCKNFGTIHNKEQKENVRSEIDNCMGFLNRLTIEGGASFNRAYIHNQIVKKLNSAACDGYRDARDAFGPDHRDMSEWQWKRFTESCDCCTALLVLARNYIRTFSLLNTIRDNAVLIGEAARDSCSWKFDVNSWTADHYVKEYCFTESAKESRTKDIDEWKTLDAVSILENHKEALEALFGDRIREGEILARAEYWKEHAEEKAALDREKEYLEGQSQQISEQLQTLPVLSEIEQQKANLDGLKQTLAGLGLFKIKEKKALQSQINAEETRLNELKERQKREETTLREEFDRHQKRIAEITEELTKSRGCISKKEENRFIFENAVKDGKLTVTPNMLIDYFNTLSPNTYQASIEEKKEVPLFPDLSAWGKVWAVSFINPMLPEDEQDIIATSLYLFAETPDSPIQEIVLTAFREKVEFCDYCKVAADILLALCEDTELTRDHVEGIFDDVVWNEEHSYYGVGPFRVEHITHFYKMFLDIPLVQMYTIIRVD